MAAPRLLVVYGRGSAARPTGIAAAARPYCEPVFLADLADPVTAADLAGAAVGVEDVAGLPPAAVSARAAALDAAGIVTFAEPLLPLTARLAAACGLPYHDPQTVRRLVDKAVQRRTLAAAGVQATPCAVVTLPRDLDAALELTGTPAVLKPVTGAGSVDTCLVRTEEECRRLYGELTARGVRPFVLERFLPGDPAAAGPFWGDFISVESLVADGAIGTVAVTGRLPLAEPLRETGLFVPSTLDPEHAAAAVRIEQAALRALGVRHGATHTELKLTPDGPRIIEVNGRMGGRMDDVVRRATGTDFLALAIQEALGLPVRVPAAAPSRVAFQYIVNPPDDSCRPGPAGALEELYAVPGVEYVDDAGVPAGWRPDWRRGTEWRVALVYGSAPDHAALRETVTGVRAVLERFWIREPVPAARR